jgi:N-acetylglucosaminyldiphosphoundecaprenol N-acetyl-beta-D-mannosaminyltransferase
VIHEPRIDVLGSRISAVDAGQALQLIDLRLSEGGGGYICFCNVHTVVMGRRSARMREITNSSFLSLADGKPVFWVARRQGSVGHVPGPDFMKLAVDCYRKRRHFLYGSTPEVLDRLASKLREAFPDINICGALSPPFRALSWEEKQEHYATICTAKAELVWVGLGAPKQEEWMAEAFPALRPAILLGVGAAFDFHSELVSRAPRRMRAMGLEWLYRLFRQPRRLWRRYLVTNTLFLAYLIRDALRGRHDAEQAYTGKR